MEHENVNKTIIVGVLGTISMYLKKRLGKLEIRERIESIQTTWLKNVPGYSEESDEESCSHSHGCERTIQISTKSNCVEKETSLFVCLFVCLFV